MANDVEAIDRDGAVTFQVQVVAVLPITDRHHEHSLMEIAAFFVGERGTREEVHGARSFHIIHRHAQGICRARATKLAPS